jgi:hypothetical protein
MPGSIVNTGDESPLLAYLGFDPLIESIAGELFPRTSEWIPAINRLVWRSRKMEDSGDESNPCELLKI